MGGGLVVLALVRFAAVLVSMDERGVVVLVLVVAAAVLELAEHAARVTVRDMPVIVRMDARWMRVLMALVADDPLGDPCLLHS
jgi:hypothetical protein